MKEQTLQSTKFSAYLGSFFKRGNLLLLLFLGPWLVHSCLKGETSLQFIAAISLLLLALQMIIVRRNILLILFFLSVGFLSSSLGLSAQLSLVSTSLLLYLLGVFFWSFFSAGNSIQRLWCFVGFGVGFWLMGQYGHEANAQLQPVSFLTSWQVLPLLLLMGMVLILFFTIGKRSTDATIGGHIGADEFTGTFFSGIKARQPLLGQFIDLLSWPDPPLDAKGNAIFSPFIDSDPFENLDDKVISAGETVIIPPTQVKKSNGEVVYLEGFKTPVYNAKGKVAGVFNVANDITDRIALQHELEEKETVFRSVFEKNHFGIIRVNGQRIIDLNSAFTNILGYTKKEALGKSFLEFLHPDDRDNAAQLSEAFNTGTIEATEYAGRVIRKDGAIREIKGSAQRLPSSEGLYKGVIVYFMDVTPLRDQEKAVHYKERNYKYIYDNAEQGIMIFDVHKNKIIDCNRRTVDLFGCSSRREFLSYLPDTFSAPIQPGNIPFKTFLQNEIEKAHQLGTSTFTKLGRRLDGSTFWEKVVAIKDFGEDHQYFWFIVTDISEQVESSKETALHRYRFQSLFNHAFDAVLVLDKGRSDIIDFNERAAHVFQLDDQPSQQNMPLENLLPRQQLNGQLTKDVLQDLWNQMNQGKTLRRNLELMRKDGSVFETEITIIRSREERDEILMIVRDLTETFEVEQALRKSESHFRSLFKNLFEGVMIYNYDQRRVVECNQSALDIFKVDSQMPNDLIALQRITFLLRESKCQISALMNLKSIQEAEETGVAFNTKFSHVCHRLTGEAFDAELMIIRSARSEKEVIIVVKDISVEVNAQKDLRIREEFFKAIFHYSPYGIAIREIESDHWVNCNAKMAELLNCETQDLIGIPRATYTAAENVQELKENEEALYAGKIPNFTVIKKYKRKGDSSFWARILRSYFTVRNQRFVVGFVENIDEELNRKKALAASEKRYKTLYENAPLGFLIVDIDQEKKGLECNTRWAELLECDKKTVLKGDILQFSPTAQGDGTPSSEKLKHILGDYRKSRQPLTVEWMFKSHKKRIFHCEVTLMPLEWKGKQETLMIARDISEQKRQKNIIEFSLQELNQKNKELQNYIESNLQLENFAYIASHDLKSPLVSIRNFANLLEEKASLKLDDQEREFLHYIIQLSNNMNQLVDDLLSYSLVNSQHLKIDIVNLQTLLDDLLIEFKREIANADAHISFNHIPTAINADYTQMIQLFRNLLGNALKFRKKDMSPIIEISAAEQKNDWLFSITDNGVGIKPEFKEKIFLLFRKLHNQKDYPGTGIGLAICKRVIECHEGSIWVDSEFGEGTSFYFTISKRIGI